MRLRALLSELAWRRVSLSVEGEALKVRAPPGALTEPLRDALRQRKAEVIAFLRDEGPGQVLDALVPVPRDGPMPLSVPQDWMWYWDQVDPNNAFLHLPFVLGLRGELDRASLDAALGDLVARHETLRSTFRDEGEGPRVHIHPSLDAAIPLTDLRHLPPDAAEREARRLIDGLLTLPFDVGRGPLFRMALYRLADDRHWLAGSLHHLVADMASTVIVHLELMQHYERRRAGGPPLPPLGVQYADYAVWQRRVYAGERRERLLRFWRERLAGAPPVALPADRARPRSPSRQGGVLFHAAPEGLAARVERFCRAQHTSLSAFAFAVITAALHQCSGQTDLLLGCSINGRSQPALLPLIANLGWDVGLRNDLSGDPSFSALVQRADAVLREALDHQDLPVSEAFRTTRQGPRETFDPFFKVMTTSLIEKGGPPLRSVEAAQVPLWPRRGSLYYDLFATWVIAVDQLYLVADYATDLFEAATVERLLRLMVALTEAGLAAPETPLSQLPFDAELRARAAAFEAPPTPWTLTATFTAEPLRAGLAWWSEALRWPWQVHYAAFGQVFQELLRPDSALSQNRQGINAVLVRVADLAPSGEPAAVAAAVDQLIAAVAAAVAPVLLVLCPSPDGAFAEEEARIGAALAGAPGVVVSDPTRLAALYPLDDLHDPAADAEGRIPYTPAGYAALATLLARRAVALWSQPRKVIVADCDNTLWGGVVAELGPEDVELEPGHLALQRALLAARAEGVLLCLCSKNEEEDVAELFALREDMPLRWEHFTAVEINWRSKSQNLRALAQRLSLGLDSFVFLDDNPLECAEVRAACPEVLVVPVPPGARGAAETLDQLWPLDRLVVTAEDRARAAAYARAADRARLAAEAPSFADFLARLGLEVEVAELSPAAVARVAQLTQRTNQFNSTTLRLSEAEVAARGAAGCLVTSARDRYGDHGLVGATLLGVAGEALRVDGLLESCRTLGRGVEHRMLAAVGERALAAGLGWVEVPVVPSARNRPVRDFLDAVAAELAGSEPLAGGGYRLRAAALAGLRLDPNRVTGPPQEVAPEPERPPEPAPRAARRGPGLDAEGYVRIAQNLGNAAAIAAAVASRPGAGAGARRAPYVAPRTEVERALARIWGELLGLEQIGLDDDFSALGGDSVMAIQMVGRARAAGISLSASDLLQREDLSGVAALAERARTAGAG